MSMNTQGSGNDWVNNTLNHLDDLYKTAETFDKRKQWFEKDCTVSKKSIWGKIGWWFFGRSAVLRDKIWRVNTKEAEEHLRNLKVRIESLRQDVGDFKQKAKQFNRIINYAFSQIAGKEKAQALLIEIDLTNNKERKESNGSDAKESKIAWRQGKWPHFKKSSGVVLERQEDSTSSSCQSVVHSGDSRKEVLERSGKRRSSHDEGASSSYKGGQEDNSELGNGQPNNTERKASNSLHLRSGEAPKNLKEQRQQQDLEEIAFVIRSQFKEELDSTYNVLCAKLQEYPEVIAELRKLIDDLVVTKSYSQRDIILMETCLKILAEALRELERSIDKSISLENLESFNTFSKRLKDFKLTEKPFQTYEGMIQQLSIDINTVCQDLRARKKEQEQRKEYIQNITRQFEDFKQRREVIRQKTFKVVLSDAWLNLQLTARVNQGLMEDSGIEVDLANILNDASAYTTQFLQKTSKELFRFLGQSRDNRIGDTLETIENRLKSLKKEFKSFQDGLSRMDRLLQTSKYYSILDPYIAHLKGRQESLENLLNSNDNEPRRIDDKIFPGFEEIRKDLVFIEKTNLLLVKLDSKIPLVEHPDQITQWIGKISKSYADLSHEVEQFDASKEKAILVIQNLLPDIETKIRQIKEVLQRELIIIQENLLRSQLESIAGYVVHEVKASLDKINVNGLSLREIQEVLQTIEELSKVFREGSRKNVLHIHLSDEQFKNIERKLKYEMGSLISDEIREDVSLNELRISLEDYLSIAQHGQSTEHVRQLLEKIKAINYFENGEYKATFRIESLDDEPKIDRRLTNLTQRLPETEKNEIASIVDDLRIKLEIVEGLGFEFNLNLEDYKTIDSLIALKNNIEKIDRELENIEKQTQLEFENFIKQFVDLAQQALDPSVPLDDVKKQAINLIEKLYGTYINTSKGIEEMENCIEEIRVGEKDQICGIINEQQKIVLLMGNGLEIAMSRLLNIVKEKVKAVELIRVNLRNRM